MTGKLETKIRKRVVCRMDYIIFDLEWNRLVKSVKTRCPDEIIQIGAVKYNSQMQCIGSFNRLIRPVLYKKLNLLFENLQVWIFWC